MIWQSRLMSGACQSKVNIALLKTADDQLAHNVFSPCLDHKFSTKVHCMIEALCCRSYVLLHEMRNIPHLSLLSRVHPYLWQYVIIRFCCNIYLQSFKYVSSYSFVSLVLSASNSDSECNRSRGPEPGSKGRRWWELLSNFLIPLHHCNVHA